MVVGKMEGRTSGKREGRTSGKIGEEIMEEGERYLGVWFDRKLRGNVHLEMMANKAEECGLET